MKTSSVKTSKQIGITMMIAGLAISILGFINSREEIVNLGICAIFIGVVLFSFSREVIVPFKAYHDNLQSLAKFFEVRKAVIIPPNQLLRDGGIFLTLNEDYEIDPARLEYSTPIISGREKEAGIFIKPPGSELIGELEEISFEAVSSFLKAANLLKSARVFEDEKIKLFAEVNVDFCSESCRIAPCLICSSLLLSISAENNQLLEIEDFRVEERIEVTAKKIGGVERWM